MKICGHTARRAAWPALQEAVVGLQSIIGYRIEKFPRGRVAFVGQGPALDVFARAVAGNDFLPVFPRSKIIGWVPTPGSLPDKNNLRAPDFLLQRPLFADIADLFSFYPGTHLAIDLTPDSRHMQSMRLHAPATVSLCTAESLLRFCVAKEDGRLAAGGEEGLSKSGKFFSLLVDHLDGEFLLIDQNGVILDVNRRAAEKRGMKECQIIGKHYTDKDIAMCFCQDRSAQCVLLAARESGRESGHTVSEIMPSGKMRYIQISCFPVEDMPGLPPRYLYVRRDITERRHLEQRLQQTEKMAVIGELSTYMAHEIRNPLFSIGGFANALLRNTSLNDLAKEKARIIYDEARRLDEILTNILSFARPTEQVMGEFDLEAVARQTMELMTIGSEERGITTAIDIEPGLPKASGNAENLKQCLINLLKNSLEAMPDGGTLTLCAARKGRYVQIDVKDTGRGIPASLQDNIFSPFFTTKNKGSGLGLAMTRKIIEDMGGKVSLESVEGKGTRISLALPVALAVAEESSTDNGADKENRA